MARAGTPQAARRRGEPGEYFGSGRGQPPDQGLPPGGNSAVSAADYSTWAKCAQGTRRAMTASVVGGTAETDAARRVQLDVSGMSCAACAARVETKLNKVDGVRASVNFATRVATVDAAGSVHTDELCEVVRKAGYEAAPRSRRAPSRRRSRRRARPLSAAPAGGRGGVVRAAGRPVGDVRRRAQHPVHRLGMGAHRAGRCRSSPGRPGRSTASRCATPATAPRRWRR